MPVYPPSLLVKASANIYKMMFSQKRYKVRRNRFFNFHLPKTVRSTIIFSSIFLLVLLVAGVIYTYEVDQSPDGKIKTSFKQSTLYNPITPVLPAANDKEGVAIDSITTPVSIGSVASVDINTNAGSRCTIVLLVNNVPAPVLDLDPQVADDYGAVGWTWTISSSTPVGTWPLKIICIFNSQSAVAESNITITN